jgi:large subunit ribosomal protein L25
MKQMEIEYQPRTGLGTGACKKLRNEGKIPAIFYGPELEASVPGFVPEKQVSLLVRSAHWETQVVSLTFPDGRVETALPRQIQRNPLNDDIYHVDFYGLVQGRKIRMDVPVQVIHKEECIGVKAGGVLEHILYDLSLEVLPTEIPEAILADVRDLGIGRELKVKDLSFPEGADVHADPEAVVVLVSAPRSAEEPEAEETQEVEVVGKGKKKEDEA